MLPPREVFGITQAAAAELVTRVADYGPAIETLEREGTGMETIEVPAMVMPPASEFASAFQAADEAFRNWCREPVDRRMKLTETRRRLIEFIQGPSGWRGLKATRHRLCPAYRRQNRICGYIADRTDAEVCVYDALRGQTIQQIVDGVLTPEGLDRIAVDHFGSALRTTGIRTLAGADGIAMQYPRPEMIPTRLGLIKLYVSISAGINRTAAAVACSALLKNLHPLSDGNGRLSRVLFNLLLWEPHGPMTYLPLYEFREASCGSETLALRMAEQFGSWGGLYLYFDTVLRLFMCSEYTWCQ